MFKWRYKATETDRQGAITVRQASSGQHKPTALVVLFLYQSTLHQRALHHEIFPDVRHHLNHSFGSGKLYTWQTTEQLQ